MWPFYAVFCVFGLPIALYLILNDISRSRHEYALR
jgi:hypothetical protein